MRIEPYGMAILLGLLIVLPLLGAQLGLSLGFVSRFVAISTNVIVQAILQLTGNS
jgi:hypothetical protein